MSVSFLFAHRLVQIELNPRLAGSLPLYIRKVSQKECYELNNRRWDSHLVSEPISSETPESNQKLVADEQSKVRN